VWQVALERVRHEARRERDALTLCVTSLRRRLRARGDPADIAPEDSAFPSAPSASSVQMLHCDIIGLVLIR
jgi:hypothetical protein